jgi:hypothetical protein
MNSMNPSNPINPSNPTNPSNPSNLLTLEYHRNPLRLELFRHVLPLCIFVCFMAIGLGYQWARTAYSNFERVNGQPISQTSKLDINQNLGREPVPAPPFSPGERLPAYGGVNGERPYGAYRPEVLSRVR